MRLGASVFRRITIAALALAAVVGVASVGGVESPGADRSAAIEVEIVFGRTTVGPAGGERALYAVTPRGRLLRRVVGGDAAEPASSPDGRAIAFSRMSGQGRNARSSIWTTSADGSDTQRLTADAEQHFLPSWAPDGKRLAFEAWTDRGIRIAVVSATGGRRRIVTRGAHGGGEPDWAPDGRSIVYVRQRGSLTELWVTRPDGSSQRRLVSVPGLAADPAWSPDGRWIAFGGNGGGEQFHVYLLRRDGKRLRKVVRGGQPDWSPDGRRLVFASQRDGDPEIFVSRRDGTAQRRLTDNGISDMHPTWRPAAR